MLKQDRYSNTKIPLRDQNQRNNTSGCAHNADNWISKKLQKRIKFLLKLIISGQSQLVPGCYLMPLVTIRLLFTKNIDRWGERHLFLTDSEALLFSKNVFSNNSAVLFKPSKIPNTASVGLAVGSRYESVPRHWSDWRENQPRATASAFKHVRKRGE